MDSGIDKLLSHLMYVEPACCVVLVCLLLRSRETRRFVYFLGLICIRFVFSAGGAVVLHLSSLGLDRHRVYEIYFYLYWISYALEAILSLLVIYSIFKLAMAPLQGLQTLGILVFRWVAVISVAVSIGVSFAPHLSGVNFMVAVVTQLQQTTSILTLCLLLFVCFAIRPMGLSFRSRIFGVSVGLGLLATVNLIYAAWISRSPSVYSAISLINDLTSVFAIVGWSFYFAFPEPKRRLVVLPTTSPFLRWNQISMALGDDPGYVAVGGIPPDLFAPAELEVMRRASVKMSSGAVEPPAGLSISA